MEVRVEVRLVEAGLRCVECGVGEVDAAGFDERRGVGAGEVADDVRDDVDARFCKDLDCTVCTDGDDGEVRSSA